MRWRVETYSEKMDRLRSWAEWFAWFPIRLDGQVIWLETVERRFKNPEGSFPQLEYRPKHSLTVKQK